MAGSSASLHENEDTLSPETIDRHRAIVSIMEELEAVDWYDQRIDAARDLFTNKRLLEIEEEAEGKDGGPAGGNGSLGIGSLRS
jgi:hypothetical protein